MYTAPPHIWPTAVWDRCENTNFPEIFTSYHILGFFSLGHSNCERSPAAWRTYFVARCILLELSVADDCLPTNIRVCLRGRCDMFVSQGNLHLLLSQSEQAWRADIISPLFTCFCPVCVCVCVCQQGLRDATAILDVNMCGYRHTKAGTETHSWLLFMHCYTHTHTLSSAVFKVMKQPCGEE